MGCEERECDYCKCVSTSYSIIECDVCDKYVCHEKCDFIKIPEFIFDGEISTCGYCQQKKKMIKSERKDFQQIETDIRKIIDILNKELLLHYKKLENL